MRVCIGLFYLCLQRRASKVIPAIPAATAAAMYDVVWIVATTKIAFQFAESSGGKIGPKNA